MHYLTQSNLLWEARKKHALAASEDRVCDLPH